MTKEEKAEAKPDALMLIREDGDDSMSENDVYTIPGATYLCKECGRVHPVHVKCPVKVEVTMCPCPPAPIAESIRDGYGEKT